MRVHFLLGSNTSWVKWFFLPCCIKTCGNCSEMFSLVCLYCLLWCLIANGCFWLLTVVSYCSLIYLLADYKLYLNWTIAVEEEFSKFIFFLGICVCVSPLALLCLTMLYVIFIQNGLSYQIYYSRAFLLCENECSPRETVVEMDFRKVKNQIWTAFLSNLYLTEEEGESKTWKNRLKKTPNLPFNKSWFLQV